MLYVSLVTPEKKIFTEKPCSEIFVPGFEGQLNILEGHASFMTTLETGFLKTIGEDGKLNCYTICSGYCEVNNDQITILAETAEAPSEIDIDRAKKAYETAQKKLSDAGLSVEELDELQWKIKKADLRLELAQNYRENN